MSARIFSLIFAVVATCAWAQDEGWDDTAVASSSSVETAAPASSAEAPVVQSSSSSVIVVTREVPVRYWVSGDSVEQEAIFVKIENDTVYLKAPNEAEQKKIEKLLERANNALQASNGQEVEEDDDDEEVEIKKDTAEIIMTDAVKNSLAEESDSARAAREAAEQLAQDASDDFETALKNAEVAKVEEEIRQREIQDSIELPARCS